MFDINQPRVGFACHYLEGDLEIKTKTTTVTYCKKLTKSELNNKLESLVVYNIESYLQPLLQKVAEQTPVKRMARLSSEILPIYTHEVAKDFYASKNINSYIQKELKKVGEFAKKSNIRLSFHPGQFVILNNPTGKSFPSALEEFEYHTRLFQWMELGDSKGRPNGFCINIHVGGKSGGISGLLAGIKKLSTDSRNLITIENCEFCYHPLQMLDLTRHRIPIVLDLHHYWINRGIFPKHNSIVVKLIRDSWAEQECRPKMHISQSHPHLLNNQEDTNFKSLLKTTNRSQLRAHSDWLWNNKINNHTVEFLKHFDIMVEAKKKNLARDQLIKGRINDYHK
jgi:UV DNA damage repair endonuclease